MAQKQKTETLQVQVPASVKRQLSIAAAHEGGTIRTVVLKALRKYGIKVNDCDLVDRRRAR